MGNLIRHEFEETITYHKITNRIDVKFSLFQKTYQTLRQPYPFFYDSVQRIFLMAGALMVGVSLFLYFIQPFSYDFDEHRFSFWIISLLNGLLVGSLFLVYTGMIRGFAPRLIDEEYWTLGRELSFWLLFLLLTGVGNFFLRELIYDNPNNLSFHYFRTEVIHALIVGSFFLLFIVSGKYLHIVSVTTGKAASWNKVIRDYRKGQMDDSMVTITSDSPSDNIRFRIQDFLYAKVDGNYIEYYLMDNNEMVKSQIKRNTMLNVEKQLKDFPNIIRVHRSYMVNIYKVESVSGNAQGYRLGIKNCNSIVPVSRSYISIFDAMMK